MSAFEKYEESIVKGPKEERIRKVFWQQSIPEFK
jgi:hypothetical protein